MEIFEDTISRLCCFVEARPHTRIKADARTSFPPGGTRNIVFNDEMALELGSPEMESASSIMWTENIDKIEDMAITLVGPDMNVSRGGNLPFAQVILAAVDEADHENCYERYREMDQTRFNLDLAGYMLRAVAQYERQWCRISGRALDMGLSFGVTGTAHLSLLKRLPFVIASEIVYVTSSSADVLEIRDITRNNAEIIQAMNRMVSEMDFDCDSCDYQEICDETDTLRKIREKLKK